ncbi:hypothetical protein [Neotabrizicola shimadae]|uniref:Uncharacterized protein n=1 Tax=Neotabrizicola shimadae TaxID=2807096 RepID=A0A8G0ZTI4_9RHOB|nr:hypothetical protein [Neotabrizicola shimadae]QYZ71131.1 hypothetical protein JO391_06385 [Neotabrizicola shimadae]
MDHHARSIALTVAAGTVIVLALLAIWRILQPLTQGAALALILLALLVFLGTRSVQAARRRAWGQAAIRPASPLAPLLTGRIGATARAIGVTAIAVPLTAAEVVLARPADLWLLAALVPLAALAQAILAHRLGRHLHRPWADPLADRLALALVGGVFVGLHVWLDWTTATLPGYLHLPFAPAMQQAMADVPGPAGPVTEALQAAQAGDAARMWLLLHLGPDSPFAALRPLAVILHLVTSALAVLSVAQVAIAVRQFCENLLVETSGST